MEYEKGVCSGFWDLYISGNCKKNSELVVKSFD